MTIHDSHETAHAETTQSWNDSESSGNGSSNLYIFTQKNKMKGASEFEDEKEWSPAEDEGFSELNLKPRLSILSLRSDKISK